MLDNSIAKDGFISALTCAADGEVFDGSARLETVYSRFGEDVEPIIVRSKGDRPIIHIREDIPSADDPRAKRLAIAANRVTEVDLSWDTEVLEELSTEINLGEFWKEEELDSLLEGMDNAIAPDDEPLSFDGDGGGSGSHEKYPLAIVLTWAQKQEWDELKRRIGEKKDTTALLKLMEIGV
jgi:hypothetical protein